MTESEQAAKNVVDKVGATLKAAFEKPTPRMPLRRHHDDDYVDRIEISDVSGASLQAYIVPRYKTSGLSGDEWRIHAQLTVAWREDSVVDRHFHSMKDLTEYAPFFLWSDAKGLLSRANGLRLLDLAETHGRHARLSAIDSVWVQIEVQSCPVMTNSNKSKKRRTA